jgi:hypothetical protein
MAAVCTSEALVQICTSIRRRMPDSCDPCVYSLQSDWQRNNDIKCFLRVRPAGDMRYLAPLVGAGVNTPSCPFQSCAEDIKYKQDDILRENVLFTYVMKC